MSRFTLERPTLESDADRAAQSRAVAAFRRAHDPGAAEAFGLGFLGGPTATIGMALAEPTYPDDPTWEPDPTFLNALVDGIDSDLWSAFNEARSRDHAFAIKSKLMYTMERREKLAASGWVGTAAQIIPEVLDPIALSANFVSGGIAGALNVGSKAGRLARLARAGLVSGAVFTPIELARNQSTPGATGRDLAQGVASAFLVGGLGDELAATSRGTRFGVVGGAAAATSYGVDFAAASLADDPEQMDGAWLGAMQQMAFAGGMAALPGRGKARPGDKFGKVAATAYKDALFKDVLDAGETLTPEGVKFFSESIRIGERIIENTRPLVDQVNEYLADADAQVAAHIARTGEAPRTPGPFPYESIPVTAENAGGMSGGLPGDIEVAARPITRRPGDFDFSNVHPASPSMTHARDLPGLGNLPDVANVPISFGMAEMISSSAHPVIRFAGRLLATDFLPAKDGSPVVFDAFQAAGQKHRERVAPFDARFDAIHARYAKRVAASGGKPLTKAEFAESAAKLKRRRMESAVGEVNEAIALAEAEFVFMKDFATRHEVPGFDLFATDPGYVPRIADRAKIDARLGPQGSGGYLTEFVARAIMAGHVKQGGKIAPQRAIEMASHWLRNANAGWGQYLLSEFMEAPGSNRDKGVPTRAKMRLVMDESYSEVLPDGTTLTLDDLLVNDITSLVDSYVEQASGASAFSAAMRRLSDEFRPYGMAEGERIHSIDDLMKWATRIVQESNDKSQLATLERLETVARAVLGHPLHEVSPNKAHLVNILTNLQVFRLMGTGTAIQNMAEFSGALYEAGGAAVARQMPNVFDYQRMREDGLFTHQGMRELQLMGLGVTRSMGRSRTALRTSGTPDMPGAEATLGRRGSILLEKADRWSRKFANVSTDLAGLRHGNDWLQSRVGLIIQQKLYDVALSGKPLTPDRLADMGLRAEMGERILAQVREHAPKTASKGPAGVVVNGLNMAAWTDLEAAAALRRLMTIDVNRLILQGNSVQLSHWMTTPLGRIVIQFRQYPAIALRSKLLHGIQKRDASIVARWGFEAAAQALTYVFRMWVMSLPMQDRDKFLAEKLSRDEIVKAGFSRASWSTFIPMAVDTVWDDALQRGPVFSGARTTNLQGGAVMGNPTFDWVASVFKSAGSLQAPVARDYQFSQRDVDNFRKALAVPNLWGVREAFKAMSSGLPERSKAD